MTNPPNQPGDDRRMHEGEKKGLGGKVYETAQGEVTLAASRKRTPPSVPRRARSRKEVTTRSNA